MIWDTIQERLQEATDPKYRIHRLLGHGGMAGVYLAEQPSLGRFVAIKVISPLFLADPEFVGRFIHEARTVAKLNHPHIVTIHEVEQTADLHYFAMSYVPGFTLGKVMEEVGDSLSIEVIKVWLAQVGGALDYGHRRGVIHRDIKPTNIILDGEGNVKVTDFGIAKVVDQPGMTKTGVLMGTPSYMSPEQCSGGTITGKSDQYSLGTVAYQMVTGHPPFEGPTMSVLDSHLRREPAPVRAGRPDCPPDLAEAIERMLLKDPEERWGSIAEAFAGLTILNPDQDIGLRRQMADLSGTTGHLDLDGPPAGDPSGDPTSPDAPGSHEEPTDSRETVPPPTVPPRSATVVMGIEPVDEVAPAGTAAPVEAPLPADPLEAPGSPEATAPMDPPSPVEPAEPTTPSEPSKPLEPTESSSPKKPTRPSAAPPGPAKIDKAGDRKTRRLLPWLGGGALVTAAAAFAIFFGLNGSDGSESGEIGEQGQGAASVTQGSESPIPQTPPPPTETELENGRVLVEGELPEGFQVMVRGEGQAETSFSDREFSLPPGEYELQLSAAGFEPASTNLTIRAGESEGWAPELVAEAPTPSAAESPAPSLGRVLIQGDLPSGFVVVVRGAGSERRFSTPSFSLEPGSYQLQLQAVGYEAQSTRLEVAAGGDQSWSPVLTVQPPPSPPANIPTSSQGRISILGNLPDDSTIRIRGNGVDEEISGSEAQVPAGTYELQFTAQGHRTQTTSLEVGPGEESNWAPDLIREPPADLDARLRGELERLAGLLESRDMTKVRDEFPGVVVEVERVLGAMVGDRENVRDFQVGVGAMTRTEVTADYAVVEVPFLLSYRDPRNAPGQGEVRFMARFNQGQGRWVLAEMQQQRTPGTTSILP